MNLPPIIQGGMGIAVSGWQLASAVAREGQFGIVSGSGLALTFAERLTRGDVGGHLREALAAFAYPDIVERAMSRHYVPGGRAPIRDDWRLNRPTLPLSKELIELTVLANFAEVYLAKKHGGSGLIGLNLLSKVEILTLPSLYGAMLAGVDAIFMGAGIPRLIPGALDAFARGERATLAMHVEGGPAYELDLCPADVLQAPAPTINRPAFFPIVASDTLAGLLMRKSNGKVDGFIVEDFTAGGHNAPPRRSDATNGRGEPLWGDKDRPSLSRFRELGLPFYVAGGRSDSTSLRTLQAQGATGIQVGTAFAFCEESGLLPTIKATLINAARNGEISVRSDGNASPTGFPFKVVQLAGTLSDPLVYQRRERTCDAGHLRTAYQRDDGSIGWRCPAERETAYVSKGGVMEDTVGRVCLCAGLAATVGMGVAGEPCIITAGEDLRHIGLQFRDGEQTYRARDVINRILNPRE